jgi:hypothetical protein
MSGATNKWDRLDPRVPIATPIVSKVGPGWAPHPDGPRSEALSPYTYPPLTAPGMIATAGEQPAPSPQLQPTEADLRARLVEAIALAAGAQTALDHAAQAHQRARDLVERRAHELVALDGVDEMAAGFTLAALRDGTQAELPPELRTRRDERAQAARLLADADVAERTLGDELSAAHARLKEANRAAHIATVAVLNTVADSFALEILDHEAAIAKLQAKLLGFDRYSAGSHIMSAATRDFLFTRHHGRVGSSEQLAVWSDAAARLHADPMAPIEVVDPLPPKPIDTSKPPPGGPMLEVVRQVHERQAAARSSPPEAA